MDWMKIALWVTFIIGAATVLVCMWPVLMLFGVIAYGLLSGI